MRRTIVLMIGVTLVSHADTSSAWAYPPAPNPAKNDKSVHIPLQPKGSVEIVIGDEFKSEYKPGQPLPWVPLSAVVNREDGTKPYVAWCRLQAADRFPPYSMPRLRAAINDKNQLAIVTLHNQYGMRLLFREIDVLRERYDRAEDLRKINAQILAIEGGVFTPSTDVPKRRETFPLREDVIVELRQWTRELDPNVTLRSLNVQKDGWLIDLDVEGILSRKHQPLRLHLRRANTQWKIETAP